MQFSSSSTRPRSASSRGWRCSAALAVALVVVGCSRDEIEVSPIGKTSGADFGRAALVEAAAEMAAHPKDAAAFRHFHQRVEALRPGFNQRMADQAELRLTMLAIGPMVEVFDRSPRERMEVLGVTVWPLALGVDPLESETPEEYVERICAETHAVDCRHVVSEYWPLVLSAKVWRELSDRAREAVGSCDLCAEDESYAAVLRRYDELSIAVADEARAAEELGHPGNWPVAAGGEGDWDASHVLAVEIGGRAKVDGETIVDGDWRRAIAEIRGDIDLLGLHVAPDARLEWLGEILAGVRSAGYRRVALVVREPDFPYRRRQRVLSADPVALRRLPLSTSDSVQLLVQHRATHSR